MSTINKYSDNAINKVVDDLKKSKARYSCFSESHKAVANYIGIDNFLVLHDNGKWVQSSSAFFDNSRYRLRNTYKYSPPREPFILCPIYEDWRGCLVFNYERREGISITDTELTSRKNFAGYLYPDGKVSGSLRRYKATRSQAYFTISLDSLNAVGGTACIVPPTDMVFRVMK
jgi:hypothetical protein